MSPIYSMLVGTLVLFLFFSTTVLSKRLFYRRVEKIRVAGDGFNTSAVLDQWNRVEIKTIYNGKPQELKEWIYYHKVMIYVSSVAYVFCWLLLLGVVVNLGWNDYLVLFLPAMAVCLVGGQYHFMFWKYYSEPPSAKYYIGRIQNWSK